MFSFFFVFVFLQQGHMGQYMLLFILPTAIVEW